METETMKPCPWCPSGGAPSAVEDRQFDIDDCEYGDVWVECFTCGARGPSVEVAGEVNWSIATAEAFDHWNRRASGWVPVSERLPEQPGEYLVVYVDPYGDRPALVFSETFYDGDFLCDGITHWMPLPAPTSPAGEPATKEGEPPAAPAPQEGEP